MSEGGVELRKAPRGNTAVRVSLVGRKSRRPWAAVEIICHGVGRPAWGGGIMAGRVGSGRGAREDKALVPTATSPTRAGTPRRGGPVVTVVLHTAAGVPGGKGPRGAAARLEASHNWVRGPSSHPAGPAHHGGGRSGERGRRPCIGMEGKCHERRGRRDMRKYTNGQGVAGRLRRPPKS